MPLGRRLHLLDRVDATGDWCSPSPRNLQSHRRRLSDLRFPIANEIDRIGGPELLVGRGQLPPVLLGRAQGKFTVPRGRQVVWPDMMLPSTHIVKPSLMTFPRRPRWNWRRCDCRNCGIDTPARGEITAQRKTAYIVERSDRRTEEGRIVRLRQTYPARWDCRPATNTIRRPTAWILQRIDAVGFPVRPGGSKMAFNTSSANSDAHAKNYS